MTVVFPFHDNFERPLLGDDWTPVVSDGGICEITTDQRRHGFRSAAVDISAGGLAASTLSVFFSTRTTISFSVYFRVTSLAWPGTNGTLTAITSFIGFSATCGFAINGTGLLRPQKGGSLPPVGYQLAANTWYLLDARLIAGTSVEWSVNSVAQPTWSSGGAPSSHTHLDFIGGKGILYLDDFWIGDDYPVGDHYDDAWPAKEETQIDQLLTGEGVLTGEEPEEDD